MDDRLQMHLLSCHKRETGLQIEAHLVPKNSDGASTRSVLASRTVI